MDSTSTQRRKIMGIIYTQVTRTADNKKLGKIPMAWYQVNSKQQFCVVGYHFDDAGGLDGFEVPPEQKEPVPMGRLNTLNFITRRMLINSLNNDQWNFEAWPNPEVILLELK